MYVGSYGQLRLCEGAVWIDLERPIACCLKEFHGVRACMCACHDTIRECACVYMCGSERSARLCACNRKTHVQFYVRSVNCRESPREMIRHIWESRMLRQMKVHREHPWPPCHSCHGSASRQDGVCRYLEVQTTSLIRDQSSSKCDRKSRAVILSTGDNCLVSSIARLCSCSGMSR